MGTQANGRRRGKGAEGRREKSAPGTPEVQKCSTAEAIRATVVRRRDKIANAELVMLEAQGLLRRLSLADLHATVRVMRQYALPAGIPMTTVSDTLAILDVMITAGEIERPIIGSVGAWLVNHGTDEECAGALMASLPFITSAWNRFHEKREAVN